MKNKKIWIGLISAFLIICIACAFQILHENKNDLPVINKASGFEDKIDKDNEIQNINEEAASIDIVTKYDEDKENIEDSVKQNNDTAADSIQGKENQTNSESGKEQDNKQDEEYSKDSSHELDKYNTLPVPEGKPSPVEWQDVKVNKDKELKCTLSVSCKTILDNKDKLNPDKEDIVPEDGVIFPETEVIFYEGESVFNVLLREMKKNKIHMEFVMTPIYNSNYIEGIANLYEFDCGELSGWIYKVNGWVPNYGCSRYILKDGDVIEWVYTCDLGRDVGAEFIEPEKSEKNE